MKYLLGLDGGGTKSVLLLADMERNVIGSIRFGATAYREIGIKQVCEHICDSVDTLLAQNGISRTEIASAAFGLPGYDENPVLNAALAGLLEQSLGPIPLHLTNDVVVGFYGALGGEPGIEIVAGTGSIAYGVDEKGNHARCGGWTQYFSDEGSCYWAAIRAMSLFCKEADGREERGAFYDIIREHYTLCDDFDFITLMETDVLPNREKTAAFQILLSRAADMGDPAAIRIYQDAARELFDLADSVCRQLAFEIKPIVSITGGMRRAGEVFLEPLQALLQNAGMRYTEPKMSPAEGALLLAIDR